MNVYNYECTHYHGFLCEECWGLHLESSFTPPHERFDVDKHEADDPVKIHETDDRGAGCEWCGYTDRAWLLSELEAHKRALEEALNIRQSIIDRLDGLESDLTVEDALDIQYKKMEKEREASAKSSLKKRRRIS